MAAVPEFPLLWNSFSMPQFEVGDDANLSLNVDGKGAHLRGLSGQSLSPSHRADLPFPLRSAVTAGDYRRPGGVSADGAAQPLLAGDLHRDGDHDPVGSDVPRYWTCYAEARRSLLPPSASAGPGRRKFQRAGLTREAMTHLLEQVKQYSETDLPDAARNLYRAMPLVEFLTKQPVFRDWDEEYNWLYSGGCLAVMNNSQKLLHTSGRKVAVAKLAPPSSTPREDGKAEDESLLTWPDEETVLQIEATDDGREMVAVRSVTAGRFYMHRRLAEVDLVTSETPLSAVCCQSPGLPPIWALLDTSGRLTTRDGAKRQTVLSVQLPGVERRTGWFGLAAGPRRHQFRAASWERLYTVDSRTPEPVTLFRLSNNSRLFSQRDRLHAVRGSCLRSHLTLLTSSRHLLVVDSRQPRTPWLWSRLTLPPAPVYLSNCPAAVGEGAGAGAGAGDTELITVASQADNHVQAMVYDWSAGVELGVSKLLGCARPPVEASGAPGLEAERRLKLPLAGVVADRPSRGRNNVYTTNGCGDVFVHPLVPNDREEDGNGGRQRDEHVAARHPEGSWMGRGGIPGRTIRDDETELQRKRNVRKRREAGIGRPSRQHCCHLVPAWRSTVEEQRHRRARDTALRCEKVRRWPGDLKDLLNSPSVESSTATAELPRWCPPSEPPRKRPARTPRRVNKWLSRTPGPGELSDPETTPGPGQADRTPGQDQTDRTPGPGRDRTDRTPGPGRDQTGRISEPEDETDGISEPEDLSHFRLRLTESGTETLGEASSTDVSTPPPSEIEELLMQWEASDETGSETDGLSIAEELTASALRIPGSQRRSKVPRWQRRRRLSSGSSHVSSASRAPSPASSGVSSSRASSGKASSRRAGSSRAESSRAGSSRAGSVGRGRDSGAESGNESTTSGSRSVASFVTPARPLPTVNQGAAFQQFSLDLFDD